MSEKKLSVFECWQKKVKEHLTPVEYVQLLKDNEVIVPRERFKKPTGEQLIEIAILFNDGIIDQEKLTDMVAMAMLIIDRLYENGEINLPAWKELNDGLTKPI